MRATISILSENEKSQIHEATVKILSEVGMRITNERALDFLRRAGALIDVEGGIVRFPREMIEGAINAARKGITLFSRDAKHDCNIFDRDSPALATDGTAFQIFDHGTRGFRRSTSKDLFQLAILSDSLKEIDLFWPMVIAGDVPGTEHTVKEFAISLMGTGKHIQHEARGRIEALAEIEIASAILGGAEELRKRPIFSAVQCPVSPLMLEQESVDAMIEFSLAGIPIVGMSMVLSGATAPVTIAGLLAVSNAETLGALIVTQSISEGAPFIYSVSSAPVDIEGGAFLSGSPELALVSAAAAQMASHYGLPSLVAGMMTDSHVPSQQCGFEKLQTGLLPALSGASIIAGIGGLDEDNVASQEQLVIDCDIWGSILRIARGFAVDDDSISFETIRRMGFDPDYQSDIETLKRFRKEIWQPRLKIRHDLAGWKMKGAKSIEDTAHETVKEILSTHRPVPLEPDIEKRIMTIFKAFQKKCRP